MDKRLRNLVAEIPPSALGRKLEARGAYLRIISATEMEKVPRSELRVALQGLVDRAGLELERLGSAPTDVETSARAVRNCLELDLIVRYLLESAENVRNWFSLRAYEEIDILESQLRVFGEEAAPADREVLQRRVRELRALIAKHGMPKANRLPRWSELAKRYGLRGDYEALYGLFSKYIHPCAWLTVKPDHGWASTFANTFVIHAQLYAVDLAARSLKALGLDDAILAHGELGAGGG